MSEPERQPHELRLIREHPWAFVVGAAALGFLVARLLRDER